MASRAAPMLAAWRSLRDRLLQRWWTVTLGIGGVALLLRLYVVLLARPECDTPTEVACFRANGDVLYQFLQGRLIAEGHFFKNGLEHLATGRLVDSAGDPPLFSLLLGAWSALGFDTVTWQRVLASLLGAATVVTIAVLGRRLAGDIAGWVAGALAAVHPLLWINDTMLMSESLYQPAVVAVIAVACAYAAAPSRRLAVATGVMIGIAALVRAEAALLGVVLLVPLMMLGRSLAVRERWRHLLVGGLASLAVVSPWLVYNNLRFEAPVTLTSASGSVLMAGSCDTAWSGPSMGYWANCFTELGLWDPFEAAFPEITNPDHSLRAVYDESLVDEFNRREALGYIGDNLDRYPLVMMARAGRVLEVFRVSDTLMWAWKIEGRWRGPSTVGLAMYYALLVPAAFGAWRLRRAGVRLTPFLAWWPLVIVTAALTFGLTRYRVPVDVAMILLASAGVALRRPGHLRERSSTPAHPPNAEAVATDASRAEKVHEQQADAGTAHARAVYINTADAEAIDAEGADEEGADAGASGATVASSRTQAGQEL